MGNLYHDVDRCLLCCSSRLLKERRLGYRLEKVPCDINLNMVYFPHITVNESINRWWLTVHYMYKGKKLE